MFDFLELEEGEDIDMDYYMKYDDWWVQLQELMKNLEEQLEKHKKWESEDIGRDCDRLDEVEDDERDNLEDELKGKKPFDRHKFD
jgi:hypothetical protein